MAEIQESTRLNWKVFSLRLTTFPSPSAEISPPVDWWTRLMGDKPDSSTLRPKELAQIDMGTFIEGEFSLHVQPTRIDWRLSIKNDSEELKEFPHLGEFDIVLNRFSQRMLTWFEYKDCPASQRIAFGAELVCPVENRNEGYRLLLPYLNVPLDLEGASDFQLQINRPRISRSQIEGLRINRLSRWSVMMLGTTKIPLQRSQILGLVPNLQFTACRLELDINTSPEFVGEFVHTDLPQLWNELISLGKGIAEQGDIK
jgi:hypothetical protein